MLKMQPLKTTSQDTQTESDFQSPDWMLALSVFAMILLGSFTYSIYPVSVN